VAEFGEVGVGLGEAVDRPKGLAVPDEDDVHPHEVTGPQIIGSGIAQECVESKDGLTVLGDRFYPEITDPDTGDVLPDGEERELVLSSLTKEALAPITSKMTSASRRISESNHPTPLRDHSARPNAWSTERSRRKLHG